MVFGSVLPSHSTGSEAYAGLAPWRLAGRLVWDTSMVPVGQLTSQTSHRPLWTTSSTVGSSATGPLWLRPRSFLTSSGGGRIFKGEESGGGACTEKEEAAALSSNTPCLCPALKKPNNSSSGGGGSEPEQVFQRVTIPACANLLSFTQKTVNNTLCG
ncbi:hypothetical protein INR49_031130 [Caranx melampygus]|nr:hypothetical protein INR49_031130 [Caranx melampygus]